VHLEVEGEPEGVVLDLVVGVGLDLLAVAVDVLDGPVARSQGDCAFEVAASGWEYLEAVALALVLEDHELVRALDKGRASGRLESQEKRSFRNFLEKLRMGRNANKKNEKSRFHTWKYEFKIAHFVKSL